MILNVNVLFSIYMPTDNYSMFIVRAEFNNTINCIESLLNSMDCNARILCGDFNVSLVRDNAHTVYLKQFIERNDLHVSWDHES